MTPQTLLIALGIGALTGMIAALCGVGGGVIMVPCFVFFLKLGQKDAIATSLMAMIGTSLIASLKNHQNGLGNWKLALVTTIGAMVVAWFAADLMKRLSSETLTKVFGTLLLVMGLRMLITGKV